MKIEEQVLSREQMAHLRELGVDTSDASMMWVNRKSKTEDDFWYLQLNNQLSREMLKPTDDISYWFIPAYTIDDIIEKLPPASERYSLVMGYYKYPKGDTCIVKYGYKDFIKERWLIDMIDSGKTRKNVIYNMLCWLLKNHKKFVN